MNEPYTEPTSELLLDLPQGSELTAEQIDVQMQRAQTQLHALKRQQDVIEKQQRELEELSRRQEQLQQGKTEMLEKLTRAAVVLERELYEAQKRVETLREIQESFSQHYHILESINPKAWEGGELNRELNREMSTALGAIDDARAEFHKSLPRIQPDAASPAAIYDPEENDGMDEPDDFIRWLKNGFAFTLPLFVLGLLALIAYLMR